MRSRLNALLVALLVLPIGCRREAAPAPGGSTSAAVSASAPSPNSRPGVKFEHRLPAVDSVRHDVITRTIRFDRTSAGAPALAIDERLERDVKILAASPEGATKIEIRYGKVTTSTREGDEAPKANEDARSGKTFVLAIEMGQFVARDQANQPAPKDVTAAIAADHVALALPFPLPSLLPERPLEVGDEFDLSHDAVLALFPIDAEGSFDVSDIGLVFEGTEKAPPNRASFALKTRFSGVHGGRRIELDLKGTLTALLPTAWPEKLALAGSAKLLAETNPSTRVGRVTLDLVSTY